jgi:hypothetical protein
MIIVRMFVMIVFFMAVVIMAFVIVVFFMAVVIVVVMIFVPVIVVIIMVVMIRVIFMPMFFMAVVIVFVMVVMVVMVVVIIVAMAFVIVVRPIAKNNGFTEVVLDCAVCFQQFQMRGAFGQCFQRLMQPWGQRFSDPDHHIGTLQRQCLRRAQAVMVRGVAGIHEQIGLAQIAHHLRHQRMDGRDVGDNFGHLCNCRAGSQERGRGKGEPEQGQRHLRILCYHITYLEMGLV